MDDADHTHRPHRKALAMRLIAGLSQHCGQMYSLVTLVVPMAAGFHSLLLCLCIIDCLGLGEAGVNIEVLKLPCAGTSERAYMR